VDRRSLGGATDRRGEARASSRLGARAAWGRRGASGRRGRGPEAEVAERGARDVATWSAAWRRLARNCVIVPLFELLKLQKFE
jgi:hypothetical protein